jgi:hypothetical protein
VTKFEVSPRFSATICFAANCVAIASGGAPWPGDAGSRVWATKFEVSPRFSVVLFAHGRSLRDVFRGGGLTGRAAFAALKDRFRTFSLVPAIDLLADDPFETPSSRAGAG